MEKLIKAFCEFASAVAGGGILAVFAGDPHLEMVLLCCSERTVTYGVEGSDYWSSAARHRDGWRFSLYNANGLIGSCSPAFFGGHNFLNATGVAALSLEMGCRWEDVAEGFAQYRGVSRRFQVKLAEPVMVVDDYAHHPVEIRATLSAAREITRGRLIALWQPHRPSRCYDLYDEWLGVFGGADMVFVTDIYRASEPAIPGITGERIAGAIRAPTVRYAGGISEATAAILDEVREGDVVITLGAGDVTGAADALAAALSENCARKETA